MRYIKKLVIVFIFALPALFLNCSEEKDISSRDLEAILTETLIRRSLINNTSGSGAKRGKGEDSVDYHSDILKKYGYTLADFKHTIETMAKRKSNPLDGILNNVLSKIDKQAAEAEYRYRVSYRFDTSALSYYRDTVYYSEDFVHGPLTQIDTICIADTLFERGEYTITVEYKTMSDYRYPTKSMRYYFNTKNSVADKSTLWLSRTSSLRRVPAKVTIEGDAQDSLVMYFEEAIPSYVKNKKAEKLAPDTSYIKLVQVIYTPLLEDAKRRFLNSQYGDFILDREFPEIEEPYILEILAPYIADTIFAPIDSVQFRLDSIRLDSIRLDSLRIDSLRIDSLRIDSLRIDSLRIDSLAVDSLKNKNYEK